MAGLADAVNQALSSISTLVQAEGVEAGQDLDFFLPFPDELAATPVASPQPETRFDLLQIPDLEIPSQTAESASPEPSTSKLLPNPLAVKSATKKKLSAKAKGKQAARIDRLVPLSQLEDAPANSRPSYHWATIIKATIIDLPAQRGNLNDIYNAIALKYPFFRKDEETWKTAIRHNLSVKPCFLRDKQKDDRAGYWTLDTEVDPSQSRNRVRKKAKPSNTPSVQSKVASGIPKVDPESVKEQRALDAGAAFFQRNIKTGNPFVTEAFACGFDPKVAGMINRSLFALTKALLEKSPSNAGLASRNPTQTANGSNISSHAQRIGHEQDAKGVKSEEVSPTGLSNAIAATLPKHPVRHSFSPQQVQVSVKRIQSIVSGPSWTLLPLPNMKAVSYRDLDDNKADGKPTIGMPELIKEVMFVRGYEPLTEQALFDAICKRYPYYASTSDWHDAARNVLEVHCCFVKADSFVSGDAQTWTCQEKIPLWVKE